MSRSPDGRREVILSRNLPARDAGYRYWIELRENGKPEYLARHDDPASIGLVEANWTPDSGIVRVFYCDGPKPETFGFDFIKVRTLSAHEILPVIEPELRRRYGVPASSDIVSWACSAEGRTAYRASANLRSERAGRAMLESNASPRFERFRKN